MCNFDSPRVILTPVTVFKKLCLLWEGTNAKFLIEHLLISGNGLLSDLNQIHKRTDNLSHAQ